MNLQKIYITYYILCNIKLYMVTVGFWYNIQIPLWGSITGCDGGVIACAVQVLFIFICQVHLLWEVSFCNRGSDLQSLFMSFSHILNQLFSVQSYIRIPIRIWFFKCKNLWRWDPGDSNLQPELRINVFNTKFLTSMLLRRFAPSKWLCNEACY